MEKTVAYHCAPALAGIKPANIVSCYKSKIKNINGEIKRLNAELNGKDIYLEPLRECESKVLLMVYRKEKLNAALKNENVKSFLKACGYPSAEGYEACVAHLKKKLNVNSEFSHEIGAFLGYPLHDILGFIHHKNEGCLLCGEWKVYKNAEEAKKLFDRFSKCRRAVFEKVQEGKTLSQMFG